MAKKQAKPDAPATTPADMPIAAPGVAQDARAERFRERIREFRRIRAGDVEPHPKNPRTHTAAQLAAVTGLLVDVGKFRPLVAFPADGLGPAGDFSRLMYADGHGRRAIDPDEVWTFAVTDLTRAEADEALFADRTGELAGYDPVLLDSLLREVNTGCAELQQMLADLWEESQADAIADTEPADPVDAEPQTDRAAELQVKWQTAAGQLWLLGKHRLLIGDCRKPEDMARLCGADKINVAFTSPPYASQRKYDEASGFKPIPPDDYVAWWEPVQANIRKHLADDGSFFVNIKPHCEDGERVLYVFDLVLRMRRGWGWRFVDDLCWCNPGVPGAWPNRFKDGWEPVYHFAASAGIKFNPRAVGHDSDDTFSGPGGIDGRATGGSYIPGIENRQSGIALPSNVLRITSDVQKGAIHAASFPIGLPSFFIRAFSDPGDVILDPFMGSGTTCIAAENHGRASRGCEISAKYAGVILQRYADAFPDQEIHQAE